MDCLGLGLLVLADQSKAQEGERPRIGLRGTCWPDRCDVHRRVAPPRQRERSFDGDTAAPAGLIVGGRPR